MGSRGADRCREIGRDPSTLAVSVHLWGEAADVEPGRSRVLRFKEYEDAGVDRIIVQGFHGMIDDSALPSLFDDCAEAGLLG